MYNYSKKQKLHYSFIKINRFDFLLFMKVIFRKFHLI